MGSSLSEHSLDEVIDFGVSVSKGSTGEVGVSLLLKSLSGAVEFEGPEEVVSFLELGADGHDLVDEVLDAHDSVLAQLLLNDAVVSDWDPGSVHLGVSPLVHELSNGVSGWVAEGNVWLDLLDHVEGGLVDSDEGSVVDLSQSQKLEHLPHSGVHLHETINLPF